MKQPTEEQIKRFWEWCGFKYDPLKCDCTICRPNCWVEPDAKSHPNGLLVHCNEPQIDLNNLFKWAVPKLQKEGFRGRQLEEIHIYPESERVLLELDMVQVGDRRSPECEVFSGSGETTELALFWAIYKVFEEV